MKLITLGVANRGMAWTVGGNYMLNSKSIKAFVFATIYVGLGTIATFCSYGIDSCFGKWVFPLWIVTIPANFLGGCVRFIVADGWETPTLIAQGITLIIIWRALLYQMRK